MDKSKLRPATPADLVKGNKIIVEDAKGVLIESAVVQTLDCSTTGMVYVQGQHTTKTADRQARAWSFDEGDFEDGRHGDYGLKLWAPLSAEKVTGLDEYQTRTADTAIYLGKGTPLGLIYCGLKLAGEAGEVAEKIGKAMRDGDLYYVGSIFGKQGEPKRTVTATFTCIAPDRREALKGELGDVLWYVASAARELGYDLTDIAQSNLDKLASRKERGTLSGSGDDR